MTDTNQVDKTLGEQMADLLRRKPKKFDVAFCVGPDKIKVQAVKFILEASSPVFEREFEENWENGVMVDENGIPLPNVDPTTFQLFVNLIILDEWSLDSLKALKLSPNNLLNLLGLCQRYEITKAIKSLEEIADDFIQSFDEFADTDTFMKISRENLETIFSSEKMPLNETEIFYYACRWASNQCTIERLEPTGENYRQVLGGCLFEIRFPTLSTEEFTKVGLFKKNLLKAEEKLAVYEYIGLDNVEKTNYDTTQLPFKTNRRVAVKSNRSNSEKAPAQITTTSREVKTGSSFGFTVLSLPPHYKIITSPSFVCGGIEMRNSFQVSQKILLHGFGFLGPIDGDAHFDVTIRIEGDNNLILVPFVSLTFRKNIFAQKGKIFYFLLDEPIVVESSTFDSNWDDNFYYINFSLKGPNSTSQYRVEAPESEIVEASGVQFCLDSMWNDGNPLAELLFKKI